MLRRRIEELDKDNNQFKQAVKLLEEKLDAKTKEAAVKPKIGRAKTSEKDTTKDSLNEKKIQVMEDEINELRKKVIEKDRELERVEAEMSLNKKPKNMLQKAKSLDLNVTEQQNLDFKRQLQTVEQEASIMRAKTQKMEGENEKLSAEVKKLQLQVARAKATSKEKGINDLGTDKNKEIVEVLQKERDELAAKLKKILEDPVEKLPSRTPKKYSDTLTKVQTKKMIEELEGEVLEIRAIALRAGADKVQSLEAAKQKLESELKEVERRYETTQKELKLVKSKTEEETGSSGKVKDQLKAEKDKVSKLEKDLEKEKKDRQKLEAKASDLDSELQSMKKSADRTKTDLEKEIYNLKSRALQSELPSKKTQELKEHNKELEDQLSKEKKKYTDVIKKYDLIEQERAMEKVRLISDKETIDRELKSTKNKLIDVQNHESALKREIEDLNRRVTELQKSSNSRSGNNQNIEAEKNHFKTMMEEAQRDLAKKNHENDMNRDQLSQMKRENDDYKRRLEDFERIDKTHRTLSEHNSELEKQLKQMRQQLDSTEMQSKSEVASTRLRYEQQANHLQNELGSLQRQCERFKRDRDTFKQLLEGAQKTISDLKQNRKSTASISSSGDEDDKSKILTLEQQVGCLEDELSEARLEAAKLRTELVSEKSGADVKISELSSKINEVSFVNEFNDKVMTIIFF